MKAVFGCVTSSTSRFGLRIQDLSIQFGSTLFSQQRNLTQNTSIAVPYTKHKPEC